MFIYSLLAYAVGFVALVFWILSGSGLIPEISISKEPETTFTLALLNNLILVLIFAIPHSVMARAWFKQAITQFIPKPVERSTYVLTAGITLFLLSWYWQPMGGSIWNVAPESPLFYGLYILSFVGWAILFISTFLINHFDLFGLRQTFTELTGKSYTPINFKVVSFYKYVRHPIYFGGIVGLWATPTMTVTHFVFAVLLTAYFIIGALLEERDLMREFGDQYQVYRKQTPMLLPFTKRIRN